MRYVFYIVCIAVSVFLYLSVDAGMVLRGSGGSTPADTTEYVIINGISVLTDPSGSVAVINGIPVKI